MCSQTLIIFHTCLYDKNMSFQIIMIKFPTQAFITILHLIKEVRRLEMRMLGIAKFIKQDNTILIYKLLPKGITAQKQRWGKEAEEMEEGLLGIGGKPGNKFWQKNPQHQRVIKQKRKQTNLLWIAI